MQLVREAWYRLFEKAEGESFPVCFLVWVGWCHFCVLAAHVSVFHAKKEKNPKQNKQTAEPIVAKPGGAVEQAKEETRGRQARLIVNEC